MIAAQRDKGHSPASAGSVGPSFNVRGLSLLVASPSDLQRLLRYGVLLLALYLYVLLVLDPRLLFHSQSPTFFAAWLDFKRIACSWPGGLLEYISAALSQTFAHPWLGAVIITGSIGLVWWLAYRLLDGRGGSALPSKGEKGQSPSSKTSHCGLFRNGDSPWRPFLPVVSLIVLLNRFTLPLAAILAVVISLLLACGYAQMPFRRPGVRAVIAAVLCGGLYTAVGPVSVLFACLCGLIELLARRSALTGLALVAWGAAIPYLAGTYLYRLGVQDSYLRLTALEYDVSPPLASIVLYASLPLCLIMASGWPASLVSRRWRRTLNKKGVRNLLPERPEGCFAQKASDPFFASAPPPALYESRRVWVIRTTLLLAAGAAAAWLSFDPLRLAVLKIDYHVHHREWYQALAAARPLGWSGAVPQHRTDARLLALPFRFHFPLEVTAPAPLLPSFNVAVHNINRALAQTGRLLDSMFEYPQRLGASVVRLLPDDDGPYVAHAHNMDILFELGDVNEAERVACESLANVGPRPWLLERLVFINVVKNRPQAARTCLHLIARDPRHKAWSENLLQELNKDSALTTRPALQEVRSRMYRKDRVGRLAMDPDEEMLRYLLVANPHNRLAFDYLTAHYLLTLRNDKVLENMRHLKDFGYTRVPRHCEESLLLHAQLTGGASALSSFQIRPEVTRRFEAFKQDLGAVGGPGGPNQLQARDALVGRYGDTYWFYAFFGDTFFRPQRPISTTRPGEGS